MYREREREFKQVAVVLFHPILFAAMEELDGDTVRLSSRGRYAERDIVQVRCFVILISGCN